MIRRLSVSNTDLEPIVFGPGLNVLLAEKSKSAKKTDSRNRRGKSTLILCMNYVLGSKRSSALEGLAEIDATVSMDFDLGGTTVSASRDLKRPSKVRVDWSQVKHLPARLSAVLLGQEAIELEDWKSACGIGLFNLDPEGNETSLRLSARTLISYVVRLEAPSDPTKILAQQSAVSTRGHIAYMIGLNWSNASALDKVARSEEALKGFDYVANEKLVSGLPREDVLLTTLEELTRRQAVLEADVANFRVLDDRDGIVFRADQLTSEIVSLRDSLFIDRRLLDMYAQSLQVDETSSSSSDDVQAVFEDVSRYFTDGARADLSDVEAFHQTLARNRKQYLTREIEILSSQLSDRSTELNKLEEERSRLMGVLSSAGALDELIQMQGLLSTVVAERREVASALKTMREAKTSRERLRADKASLRSSATEDVAQHQDEVDELSQLFSAYVRRLYRAGGTVLASVDNAGPKLAIKLDAPKSAGVNKMKLLCFDLALMVFAHARGRHPGFLVHDSVVFDGVDTRQVSEALKMIAEVTASTNTQYICTLNSDAIVAETREASWFQSAVRREVLDTELGGFFRCEF